jgi:hypothetical protein
MNKRERRSVVMAERYAKVDQREQKPESAQSKYIDYVWSLDHPMAQVFKQVHTEAFAAGDVIKAIDFIEEWKKNNPELLKEMQAWMDQTLVDYHESAV